MERTRIRKGNSNRRLKPLPPTSPSARDEGPRLIPLNDAAKEPSRLEHYLELADLALGSPLDTGNRRDC